MSDGVSSLSEESDFRCAVLNNVAQFEKAAVVVKKV
jgi:hypothetical protein